MWINLGRLLMLLIWAFLLFNLIQPAPKPLKYFLDIAMIFMVLMHGLQLLLLKATSAREEAKPSTALQIRIFLFGVFEMLAWQKRLRRQKPADVKR